MLHFLQELIFKIHDQRICIKCNVILGEGKLKYKKEWEEKNK